MKIKRRGQVGVEYMIIIGFITFAIMTVFTLAIVYSGQMSDRLRLNQVNNFANQLLNSAESVFFRGEPSKTTIRIYLPERVEDIDIIVDGGSYFLVITTRTTSGLNVRAYDSKVPIQNPTGITTTQGIKKLTLTATSTFLDISQN